MPWNSSGTFNRKTTTVSPATSGTTVDSADMNSYTTDVTGGINACRAKNGENAATAHLPMGGFKHTNVADGTARTEYSSVGQGQDGSTQYAADTGAADAYVVTLSPAVTSNVVGRKTSFKATNTNTGASTLNLNAIGAESIKRLDGTALEAGDIVAASIYTITWDGTNYILQGAITPNVFVNESDGGPDLNDSAFDVDAVIGAAWESVGPTGSSATNIWASLDGIPSGVDWVEIYAHLSITENAVTFISSYIAARATGSSVANGTRTKIASAYLGDNTSNNKTTNIASRGSKIPVDSSGRFDLYLFKSGSSTVEASIYVTGYGWN